MTEIIPLTLAPAAQRHLVEANLRLAYWWACRYAPTCKTPEEDLQQEAIMGLMHAATKFDLSRGIRPVTYLTYWIRQALQRVKHNDTLIRPPAHRKDRHLVVSLDQVMRGQGDRVGEDTMAVFVTAPEDDTPDTTEQIKHALTALSRRERRVIHLRYVEGLTLTEAGKRLRVSKERIRQIQAMALHRMRIRLGAPLIEDFGLTSSTCQHCGVRFVHNLAKRSYCSRACDNASRVGKPAPHQRKGVTQ